ncbi:MAG: BMP family ABC transporter substrate-binding protein [Candidatus Muiribacteriota bacterium]
MKKMFFILFITLIFINSYCAKIGVLMPFMAKGDETFGYMVSEALNNFSTQFPDITIDYIYPERETSFNAYINYFSMSHDLVVAAGFMYRDAVKEAAARNINVRYILLDSYVEMPNVTCIVFDDYQASFVAGAVAGSFFNDWNFGFIGASPSFLTDNFYYGFKNGLKYSNYEKSIQKIYLSNNLVGFMNPVKARHEADFLYNTGTDIIFAPCGGSSIGVLESANRNEKYVIGIDRPFEELSDYGVIFSISKRIDRILYRELYSIIIEKNFNPGIKKFDFSNGGYEIPYMNRLDRVYGYSRVEYINNIIDKVKNNEILY